mmetsp:Transcript_71336/g.204682  ORF Transcript_71336/g.204682 Transcript_71336/m.204682 type:complete len:528 (-) Transcript_71336:879-2462(-)
MAAGLDEECLATHSSPSQTHDHARGHAIVEHVVGGEGWLADELFQVVQGHDGEPAILFILADKGERCLTGDLLQQFPEFSDARLPGVVPDEQNESIGTQIEVLGFDAMCVHRLWYEELVGDGHLLLKDITGQPDDLHSIQQRPRNRVCDVGRANEECLGQVHRSVQVQIAEGRILSRIEDLQQCRGRISAEVSAQLVDLVDQDHRVANLCDLQRLNYLPRHRSHIRAPVPTDFCNVVQTTYREAEKLPIQRPRDALPDGSLSCTRWPDQTHDLPLGGPFQEAHGHMFKDPFLDILQTIMVLVEHCLRLVDICVVRGVLAPRKHRHPVQVCPAHIEFRRLRLQTRQPAKFVLHSLGCLLRNALKESNGLLELCNHGLLVVLLQVQLALDVLQMLHQHVLAMFLGELVLDLRLELRLKTRVLQVFLHYHQDLSESIHRNICDQDSLELIARSCGHSSDEVGQLERVIQVVVLDDLLELIFVHEGRLQQILHGGDDLVMKGSDVIAIGWHLNVRDALNKDGAQRMSWRRL